MIAKHKLSIEVNLETNEVEVTVISGDEKLGHAVCEEVHGCGTVGNITDEVFTAALAVVGEEFDYDSDEYISFATLIGAM